MPTPVRRPLESPLSKTPLLFEKRLSIDPEYVRAYQDTSGEIDQKDGATTPLRSELDQKPASSLTTELDIKGTELDIKGTELDVKGTELDIKGTRLDVKNTDPVLTA